MTVFELEASLGLDSKSFIDGLRKAENAAGGFAQTSERSLAAGTVALGNLLSQMASKAGDWLIRLGKTGFNYNAQMEEYTTNFQVMLGSQEAAVSKVEELRTMAAKTPFGMDDLASNTQTLLSFGIEAEQVTDILSMLGDVSLGDSQKMSSLTLAFAQMSSSGKLLGQDLNQMINAGFNPLQIISEKTGASIGDLKAKMAGEKGSREFQRLLKNAQKEVRRFGDDASESARLLAQIGTEGEISADLVTWAFEQATNEGGRFYNGMEEASKTLSGQWNTLKDNLLQMVGSVFEPASNFLSSKLLPDAIKFVETISNGYNTGGISGAADAAKTSLSEWLTSAARSMTLDFISPEVAKAADSVSNWWNTSVVPAADLTIGFFVDPPEASEVIASIKSWWDSLVQNAGGFLNNLLGIYQNYDINKQFSQDDLQGTGWKWDEDLEMPVRVVPDEGSAGAIQSEVSSYDLSASALVSAKPASASKLQSFLDGINLTAFVDLKPKSSVFDDGFGGGSGPGFATGLDYVPYDDYAARLHEGEAVLTKLEAERWRRGEETGKAQDNPVVVNQYITVSNEEDFDDAVYRALERYRWNS